MKITILSDPLPKLSGAALRASQAADRHADAVFTRLSAASERLTAALSVPAADLDALALVEALEATTEFRAACEARSTLAGRHRIQVDGATGHNWPIGPGLCYDIYEAARNACWEHADRLRKSGVPMGYDGISTVEYWRDAAARGC